MPQYRYSMDHDVHTELENYAQRENISVGRVIFNFVYQFIMPVTGRRVDGMETFHTLVGIDDDLARFIYRLINEHNKRNGLDYGGWKFSDGVNFLLRRAVDEAMSSPPRDP